MSWLFLIVAGLFEMIAVIMMNEVAYAIWTGIGASGGAVIGMLFYNESKDWRRVICIFLIISAVIGLKLVS